MAIKRQRLSSSFDLSLFLLLHLPIACTLMVIERIVTLYILTLPICNYDAWAEAMATCHIALATCCLLGVGVLTLSKLTLCINGVHRTSISETATFTVIALIYICIFGYNVYVVDGFLPETIPYVGDGFMIRNITPEYLCN